MNNIFVFDIETVPDVEGARRIHGLEGLSDHDTANALFALTGQRLRSLPLKLA